MNEIRNIVLIALLLPSNLSLVEAGGIKDNIWLTDPLEIAEAQHIDDSINALGDRVNICIEKKLANPDRCFCLYPDELNEFISSYQTALSNHPEWSNQTVSWRNSASSMGFNLYFPGLKRQVEIECP